MRVLAVGAHPDDLEFQVCGTLAKYAKRGDHITLAVATNGEVGSMALPKAEIAAIRKEEAAASARVIGADFIWMNFPDEFLFSNEQTRLTFLNMVRQANPDVILTHAPTDYHPDHRLTGSNIWDIRVMTTVPNIKTEAPPMTKIPEIFYFDTLAGIDFVPQYYVDISEVFEIKKQMLSCHRSQFGWCEAQYGMTLTDFMEVIARFRGIQCGVRYGEGFQASPTWPKQHKQTLLP